MHKYLTNYCIFSFIIIITLGHLECNYGASNSNKEKHCLYGFQKTGSINKRHDVVYCSEGTKSPETSCLDSNPSSATYCVTTASYLMSLFLSFFDCLKQRQ